MKKEFEAYDSKDLQYFRQKIANLDLQIEETKKKIENFEKDFFDGL